MRRGTPDRRARSPQKGVPRVRAHAPSRALSLASPGFHPGDPTKPTGRCGSAWARSGGWALPTCLAGLTKGRGHADIHAHIPDAARPGGACSPTPLRAVGGSPCFYCALASLSRGRSKGTPLRRLCARLAHAPPARRFGRRARGRPCDARVPWLAAAPAGALAALVSTSALQPASSPREAMKCCAGLAQVRVLFPTTCAFLGPHTCFMRGVWCMDVWFRV